MDRQLPTFKDWLLGYIYSQTKLGDLARSVFKDQWEGHTATNLKARMCSMGASDDALDTLEKARQLYQKHINE